MNAITPLAGRTHADVATAALRQALAESHAPLRDAVAAYRAAARVPKPQHAPRWPVR
jgi:hypothetical protein